MKSKHLNDLKNIKFLAFDFDGVFTDNRVWINQSGHESVVCYRSDGIGISKLRSLGVTMLVISSEKNPVVKQRCDKLNIECINGVNDKWKILKNRLCSEKIDYAYCGYMGNDIQDIECMQECGYSFSVNDAYEEVKKVADYITKRNGGYGAVREVCDLIYKIKT